MLDVNQAHTVWVTSGCGRSGHQVPVRATIAREQRRMRYGMELGRRHLQSVMPLPNADAWTRARSNDHTVAPPDPPANGVRRDRLLAMLDAALQRPLTIVVAPSGYGKTVLLAQWAQWVASRDRALVRWVS